jgi:hypothetical protein
MDPEKNSSRKSKPPVSIWTSIGLLILFSFAVVSLFGALIYIFVQGAQQLGLSRLGQIVILVIISGIFAWLLKRISDSISSLSHWWFPDEEDERHKPD